MSYSASMHDIKPAQNTANTMKRHQCRRPIEDKVPLFSKQACSENWCFDYENNVSITT